MAMPEPQKLTPEAQRRQRARNIAIAVGLVVLIMLFYLITIFKLGGSVLNRAL